MAGVGLGCGEGHLLAPPCGVGDIPIDPDLFLLSSDEMDPRPYCMRRIGASWRRAADLPATGARDVAAAVIS